jgi:predicted transcriptional regulator
MNSRLQERLAPLKGNWAKVANIANVSPMTVYRIVWGAEHDHRMDTYRRISAAIDVVALEMQHKK